MNKQDLNSILAKIDFCITTLDVTNDQIHDLLDAETLPELQAEFALGKQVGIEFGLNQLRKLYKAVEQLRESSNA